MGTFILVPHVEIDAEVVFTFLFVTFTYLGNIVSKPSHADICALLFTSLALEDKLSYQH